MPQILVPNADELTTGWGRTPGGGTFYSKVNTQSDSSYIDRNNDDDQTAGFGLTNPGATPGSGDHIARIRVASVGSTASNLQYTVEIYEGDPDTGTQICTDTQDCTTSAATYTYTLSGAEAANITDYTDLYIRITLNQYGASDGDPTIYWAEFEVPDASSGGTAGIATADVSGLGCLGSVTAGIATIAVAGLTALGSATANLATVDVDGLQPSGQVAVEATANIATAEVIGLGAIGSVTADIATAEVSGLQATGQAQAFSDANIATAEVSGLGAIGSVTADIATVEADGLQATGQAQAFATADIATADVAGLSPIGSVTADIATVDVSGLGLLVPGPNGTANLTTVGVTGLEATAATGLHARISAHRSTGVAPLLVVFDCTGTTSNQTANPIRDLAWKVKFNDIFAGTYSTSGESRDEADTPVAAHVFEEPGAYVVAVKVEDANGTTDTAEVTITVTDPDTVFSTTNTICVSTSGDFDGAPSGATQQTTSSYADIISYCAAGKRVLLRRGEVWTTASAGTLNVEGPGILGAFGAGAKPIIRATADIDIMGLSHNLSPDLADWRVMDIEFDSDDQGGGGIKGDGVFTNCLAFNLTMRGCLENIFWAYPTDPESLSGNGIVRCEAVGQYVVTAENVFRISGTDITFLENTNNDLAAGAPVIMRCGWYDRFYCAHNTTTTTSATSGGIHYKIHSRPIENNADISRKLCSEFNELHGSTSVASTGEEHLFSVGAEDDSTLQSCEDTLIQNNIYHSSRNTSPWAMELTAGTRFTVRNDIFVCSESVQDPQFGGIQVVDRGGASPAPDPDDVLIEHLTYYNDVITSEPAEYGLAVQFGSMATNCVARNIVAYTTATGARTIVQDNSTGGTVENIVDATGQTETDIFNPAITSASPAASEFALESSTWSDANLLDQATNSVALKDFYGNFLDSAPDIGAIQRTHEGTHFGEANLPNIDIAGLQIEPTGAAATATANIASADVEGLSPIGSVTANIGTAEVAGLSALGSVTAGIATAEVIGLQATTQVVVEATANISTAEVAGLSALGSVTADIATAEVIGLQASSEVGVNADANIATSDVIGLGAIANVTAGIATVEVAALSPIASVTAKIATVEVAGLTIEAQGVFVAGVTDIWTVPSGGSTWNVPGGGSSWTVP